ncbi:inorganic phosphate transporter family protein [Eubacteriales bacterium OttesenSCG-928-K08]|nr:inorganic phosphate transporter family protein [Eubacteriales bacterium OttesenSCG-928-K08]
MELVFFVSSGVFLGWSLGTQDAANVFGTAVATRVVKYRTAIILTAIFVVIGALLNGEAGIANISDYAYESGVTTGLAAFLVMLSAAIFCTVMTFLKLTVSTSQCVIGSILGWGLAFGSADFSRTTGFLSAWIITPIGALIICFLLCKLSEKLLSGRIQELVAFDNAVKAVYYIAGILSAYSLGANNVANATGIYAGKLELLSPFAAAAVGGVAIAIGVLTYSKRVMHTVGNSITALSPLSGALVVLSCAITVFIYALIGIPVSQSQAVVGAIIGAGLVKGVNNVDFKILRKIFIAWFGTPTLAALFTFLLGLLYKALS